MRHNNDDLTSGCRADRAVPDRKAVRRSRNMRGSSKYFTATLSLMLILAIMMCAAPAKAFAAESGDGTAVSPAAGDASAASSAAEGGDATVTSPAAEDVGGVASANDNGSGAYTYTVRFFAGKQGSIEGGEVLTFNDLSYGDRVTFSQRMVSLNDGSKYYVRGIRESGRDNNTVSASSFLVTGDLDYVVAYGMLGSAVAYTVNYVDTAGNALAPSETYYGNVGDKPVVAYLYIDGYEPQAYNLGLTLSENAADNVFTFIYTPIETPAQQTPENPQNTDEGDANGGANGGGNQTPAGDTDGDGIVDDLDGDGVADDANGNGVADVLELPDENVPQADGPQEYVDLDDEEVPLSDMGGMNGAARQEGSSAFEMLPVAVRIGIGVAAAAVIVLGLWLLFRRRKKQENES